MKSIIFILLSIAIFSGCGITNIEYNSEQVKIPKYIQKVENKQCMYLVGPINITKKETIKKLIEDTIKKANHDGMFGNKLVNIHIEEGGYTSPIASKLCLYITANLVYDKFLDL